MTTTVAHRLVGRALRHPRVVSRGPGGRGRIALTFDDGPSAWTPGIAEALQAHGCRGTFFLTGAAVRGDPAAAAALAGAGHETANHLWTHTDPAQQSPAELRDEVRRTVAMIEAATGTPPVLVRPPYCAAPHALARAAAGGPTRFVVTRSVDPADWDEDDPGVIADRVLSRAGDGDIVCLHDGVSPRNSGRPTRAATVEAVRRLVPALLDRGLRPVTVSELLA